MTYYMYRVQTAENYALSNNDMSSPGAALFYLHNEVVWHTTRHGTFSQAVKTRIKRYRVQVRATRPLFDLGMNFGPLNEFDITVCTGPYGCDNFAEYGYTVGCETFNKPGAAGEASNWPHPQFGRNNSYPDSMWWSLPGACPFLGLHAKTEECKASQPGGRCPDGVVPTGTGDCTWNVVDAGEVSIDELEGISNFDDFVARGGREYDPNTDKGVHMSFWDGKFNQTACAWRTDRLQKLFKDKYPEMPDLVSPPCDFNRFKFYPTHF